MIKNVTHTNNSLFVHEEALLVFGARIGLELNRKTMLQVTQYFQHLKQK